MSRLKIMAYVEIAAIARVFESGAALSLEDAVLFAAPGASLMTLNVAASGLRVPCGGRALQEPSHDFHPMQGERCEFPRVFPA